MVASLNAQAETALGCSPAGVSALGLAGAFQRPPARVVDGHPHSGYQGVTGRLLESEPPSVVPPPSGPAEPGSPGYRSSSAPTTSVAPPPSVSGPGWAIVRLVLAAGMLILTIQSTTTQDAERRGLVQNGLPCLLIALAMAGVPMVMARYRSLRMFSWLLLIAAFFQLWTTLRAVPGT
jgi:hypothetical protein